MIIKSSAFKDGEKIPAKYTCEGDNVNPFLEIRNIPEHTVDGRFEGPLQRIRTGPFLKMRASAHPARPAVMPPTGP